MTTITLHSNNLKALNAAAEIIEKDAMAAYEIGTLTRHRVGFSFGDRVSEDAAIDYRYHKALTVEGLVRA